MFGTLVLLLPSQYSGGELVVEHAGSSRVVERGAGDGWRSSATPPSMPTASTRSGRSPAATGWRWRSASVTVRPTAARDNVAKRSGLHPPRAHR